MIETTYLVRGMTCEHCVRAVSLELLSVSGVVSVDVSLVSGGESGVTVVSGAPLNSDEVRAAVDEAGYEVVSER
jgi:copper chaperone CopZ